jgi:heme exporter protein C
VSESNSGGFRKLHLVGLLGLVLLGVGCGLGLLATPPEQHMGEVQRIFFLHVPSAWNLMLLGFTAFVAAIGSLIKRTRGWDATVEAACEVTVVFTVMVLIQGSIWGRPTWDTWWTFDPRLTTTAALGVMFAGVLSVRSFAEQHERRVVWTAVATIIAFVDVPIVYWSVDWWESLHQSHSSTSTVSWEYYWPLRANAFGILFIWIWLVGQRRRVALLRDRASADETPPEASSLVAGVD